LPRDVSVSRLSSAQYWNVKFSHLASFRATSEILAFDDKFKLNFSRRGDVTYIRDPLVPAYTFHRGAVLRRPTAKLLYISAD
jgi:hypothetical protein